MSFPFTLAIVLAATYGLTNMLLSCGVTLAWCLRLHAAPATANDLLALRLVPAAGALFLTLTVVLPAFLIYEPSHEAEETGPLLTLLVLIAVIVVGDAARRTRGALTAARRLLDRCGLGIRSHMAPTFDVVDVADPIVAVVGTWRPRILISRRVVNECDAAEFGAVIAHERAHVRARDNIKLLLLVACPDALARLPVGRAILSRWRSTAEVEADDRATGADPHRRVALAAALVRVARLASEAGYPTRIPGMAVAADDVETRVRRLLAPRVVEARPAIGIARTLIAGALLLSISAVPLHGWIYAGIEGLVDFGR